VTRKKVKNAPTNVIGKGGSSISVGQRGKVPEASWKGRAKQWKEKPAGNAWDSIQDGERAVNSRMRGLRKDRAD